MRILVTGATGFVGRQIVKALNIEGHDLVLTSRRGHKPDDRADAPVWRTIDFAKAHSPDDWREIVEDIDVVINAVGIFTPSGSQTFAALHDKAPCALFSASQKAGVRRIIQISALGTDEQATSPYHLSKKCADDYLAGLDVEAIILRPSLIIGGEGVSWHFFKALALLPFVPVIGDGAQPLQPVTINDVTRAVVVAIQRKTAVGCRINLVGSETMPQETYLRALACWMGRSKIVALHIPYALAGHLAAIGWLFDKFPLNRSAVSMLKEARVYDGKDCQTKLGFSPTGVSAFLQRNLPGDDEIAGARQYFLRGLLRLALGFMWIMAGIVSIFFHPQEQSLSLLASLGLTGVTGIVALYGAALLDVLLGIGLLARFHVRKLALFQVGLITLYTLALTWAMPSLWSDPFGALAKNIPIIVATIIMMNWEKE